MGLSINNVSMDYFLRGVDAAKPSSSAKATEDKQVKEGTITPAERKALRR